MSVEEFDSILKELPTLKAPGVSGTRIKKLTDIAVKNVAEESQLISTLYSSCKATPSSHKLGALYVVDSIVRIYMDEAKKRNEEIGASAPEGTFAAGVFKISELVESLIDDAMELSIIPSTNIKIGKLVDIWERAQTFSPETIEKIRAKHFRSHTPPGSPPNKKAELPPIPPPSVAASEPNKAASDSGSILSALASLAKKTDTPTPPQTQSPAPQAAAPVNNNATNILSQLSALAGNGAQVGANPSISSPPAQQAPSAPQQGSKEFIFNMLQQMQGNNGQGGPQMSPNMQGMPQMPGMSPQGMPMNGMPMNGMPNGMPMNGMPMNGMPMNGMPPQHGMNGMPPIPPQGMHQQGGYGNDRRGRDEGGYTRRNRSRSPQGRYGRYDDNGHDNRQNQGFQQPQEQEMNVPGNPNYRPRNMGVDNSLPQGSFKVLSRTLFIGGVPRGMDERQLASHLRPYAEVQSVILNSERKHAFVKVYSRKEAEQVIQSFNKDGALPLRTRWGVGFGPRDCCNYQHGISIIPIQRLTDADRSWVVSAQWGGTGGQPLQSGMVIDEPDIEIGTGISSKAMSKKMPTNSARNGPKSNRPGEADEQYAKTSVMGGQQDYMGYSQGSNPLTGLFNNQQNRGPPQQMPPQQGFPPQGQYGAPNGNIGAQLSNFFQNGGR